MAKLAAMPSQDVIDSFRGVLDYYAWCNLNIVRRWPRQTGPHTSPLRQLAANQFGYINKQARTLSPEAAAPYMTLASGTAFTWKDWMNRFYINAELNLQETEL